MRHSVLWALVLSAAHLSLAQDCSASNLCPEGCCSSAGYCGYGPDFCGTGCQSTCERKSQCNPGWNSTKYSEDEKCLLNVCCSEHGFCGYTDEFCKDDKVDRPSCSSSKSVDRVIGYWESWSTTQRPCMTMDPESIPYGQYTDLIFSFATINPDTFRISAGGKATESMMARIGAMKLVQPDIKIWIAIGGWAFNDPGPTQYTFSDIARSASNTETFLDSLASMMAKYNFDGVDIDWEYPVADDRHGRPEDYKNIVTFMKKMSARMDKLKKKVSMAVPASYWYLQNFDIKALESYVDWFNIMTYDVHGSWDIDNEWTGPWANSHTNMTEIQMGLDLFWRNKISPSKITMGMAFYSRSFTLTDAASCSGVGCRVASAGEPGRCSDTAGVLLHPEIAEIVKKNNLSPTLHRDAAVKTISWDNQWTSFDDVATWRLKANIARSQCISGFMVWAISHDDDKWTNAKALNQALGRETPDFPDFGFVPEAPQPIPALAPQLCRWTSCYEDCPSGFKAVQREGHDEVMLDARLCKHTEHFAYSSGQRMSKLCCPATSSSPKCRWRGHKNSGNCKPGCEVGEVEIGSLSAGCKKNYQSACCESTDVTEAYGKCYWSPCIDKGSKWSDRCGGLYSKFIVESDRGSADMPKCKSGKKRVMCCEDPAPFEFTNNCRWVKKVGHVSKEQYCEGACPKGSFRIALKEGADDPDWCYDVQAYCCDDPKPIIPREPDYDDEDIFGGDRMKEFKYVLDKYMQNPSCPATILIPDISGTSPARSQRRSLVAEAYEHDVFRRNDRDCTMYDWYLLLNFLKLMMSRGESGMDPVANYYEDEFVDSFDTELSHDNLMDFFYDYPDIDQHAHLEMMLLSPVEAAESMRNMRNSGTALCEVPTSRMRISSNSTMRGNSSSNDKTAWWLNSTESRTRNAPRVQLLGRDEDPGEVDKRLIFVPGMRTTHYHGIPDLGRIFQGIEDGDLTLHYARYQYYNNQPPGPFLELAYWIGPNPGTSTVGNTHFDAYRDTRGLRQDPDHWVVMHIHYDENNPDLLFQFNDGNTYIATDHITVFHGQQWEIPRNRQGQALGQWRVNGRMAGANAAPAADRAGWHCPRSEGVWYLGSPNPAGTQLNAFTRLLDNWGRNLFLDHYVNVGGLRMIFEAPPGTNPGDLNPANPGTLIYQGGRSTAAQGDPYTVNFLVVNDPGTGGLTFDFGIPTPPSNLES